MTLWGVSRNVPITHHLVPRFNVTGPDGPLSGNITRIWVLVHWRIGAGIPLKSTASSPGFRWPNPIPEITTGFPKGPSVGSRVMGVMTVTVTGALVLYPTVAQQDPSGKGSTEASRTSRGPLVAFDGTFTSIRVSRQRTTSAAMPLKSTSLTPICISLSFCPMVGPKFFPTICTICPGTAVAGDTSLTVGTSTVKVPTVLVLGPDLTTTGPVTALRGTLTTIRAFSQCSTKPGALLLPKSTALSLVDTNLPNPSPVIVTVMPIGPESGLIAGAAHAPSHAKTTTRTVPRRAPVVRPRSLFIVSTPRVSKEVSHYNIGFQRAVKVRGSGIILGLWRAGQPVLFLRRGNPAWLPSPGRTRRSAPTESARVPFGATRSTSHAILPLRKEWLCQRTWRMSSSSIAMFRGSSAAPRARRAWRPASPKIWTRRYDPPLMTAGCWVKPSAEATRPVSRTMRVTRSSVPNS